MRGPLIDGGVLDQRGPMQIQKKKEGWYIVALGNTCLLAGLGLRCLPYTLKCWLENYGQGLRSSRCTPILWARQRGMLFAQFLIEALSVPSHTNQCAQGCDSRCEALGSFRVKHPEAHRPST